MIMKIRKMLLCLLVIQLLFITLSFVSHAATCSNNWLLPSSQTMEMENMSASITEYANGERHFSIKQGGESIDVYYLKGALLVKGLSADKIESYSRETIWWLPMVFVVPASVLSQAVPNGPCTLNGKTPFSIKLSGAIGYGQYKLTHAEGEVFPKSPSEIVYKFNATTDPPAKDGKFILYSGTIKLSPKEAAPEDNTNILGYTLAGHARPHLVVGKSDLPVNTLGEFRRALAEKKKSSEKWTGPIPEIIMAPEEDTGTRKEIYPIPGKNRKYVFVDKKGQVVVETPCLIMEDFHDDMAICSTIVKAGYINKAGEVIVEPQYESLGYTNFSEGLAAVKKNGRWGFIDKTGKFVIEPQFPSRATVHQMAAFSEGLAAIKNDRGWGFIDREGKFVIEPRYDRSCNFHEGLAAVKNVGKDGKFGFINKTGEFVIEPQFDPNYHRDFRNCFDPECPYFSEGLAAVKKDGKLGFIDKKGKFVIEPQFDWVSDFKEGISIVRKNNISRVIDKKGKYLTKEYKHIGDFSEGMAQIAIFNGKELTHGYVDNRGHVVIEPIFKQDEIRNFSEGLAAVKKDGKWGFIDKTGKFIFEPQFDYAGSFKRGVASAGKNGKTGWIDKSGQFFVITDNVCGHDVVKNSKGEITWPRNIKELCGQKN